ncbi:interferon gamma [Carettochelys insculpta]|uniref:interferon gamma n=1 Tax=Carettochelys insculpta TaxID=44489 RepID=UPI003EBD71E2
MIPQSYLFILLSISSCFGCFFGQTLLSSIENDIETLKNEFKSNQSDVADGGSIFIERLKNWPEPTDKSIILSQIVSMYLKMFDIIGPAKSKSHIQNIRNALYTLQNSLTGSFRKVNDLVELTKIEMGDLKIQRKAVNELFPTLQKLLDCPATHVKRKRSQKKCRC